MYKVLPLALKRFSLVVTSDFDGAVSSSGGGEDSPDLDDDFYLKLQTQGLEYNSSSGTFAIYHLAECMIMGMEREKICQKRLTII